MDAAVESQLDEAMKKTGLVWVRATGPANRAIGLWHLWQNGNVNQVSAFGSIVSAISITMAIAAYQVVRRQGLRT